jgi:WD40 repeat protein
VWEVSVPGKDEPPGREKASLPAYTTVAAAVAWARDGQAVMVMPNEYGGALRCWYPATGLVRGQVLSSQADLAPDGHTLAVIRQEYQVAEWAPSISVLSLLSGQYTGFLKGGRVPAAPGVLAVSFESKTLLAAGRRPDAPDQPGPLGVWDLDSGNTNVANKKERLLLDGTKGLIRAVGLSADGKTAAAAGTAKTVWLFDAASGKLLHALEGHDGAVTTLAFSPDGKLLASGDERGVVKVWELATGKQRMGFQAHDAALTAVAFAPDGLTLATAGGDPTVRLWRTETGKEQAAFRGHTDAVLALAFAPDGKTMASAGRDATIRLWTVAEARQLRVLTGHRRPVRWLTFDPTGRTLVSCGDDGARAWDHAAGKAVRSLDLQNIQLAAPTPDGQGMWVLFAAPAKTVQTGTAQLWDLRWGEPTAVFPPPGP